MCARPASTQVRPPLPLELLLLAGAFGIYAVGRLLAGTRVGGAFDNAQRLLHIEQLLHLPSEQTVQQAVLALPDVVVRLANAYYAGVHFPLTLAVLVGLWLRRPAHYLWARRSLLAATLSGLALIIAFPTAPPRMLTEHGFVDTGRMFGQSVYGAVSDDSLTNQFAAMPSFHVGWSLLVAVVCISAARTRWRWLWLAHPLLTVFVVVVTGNHYWLDGLAGSALVGGVLVLTRRSRLPAGASAHRATGPARRCSRSAASGRQRCGAASTPDIRVPQQGRPALLPEHAPGVSDLSPRSGSNGRPAHYK